MSSSLSLEIVRHDVPEGKHVRSHVLHPHEEICIICILSSGKENILSVVEDHLLESISSTEWRYGEEETDFSYVTEKYNSFLPNLAEADIQDLSVLFAIERDSHLMLSTTGSVMVLEKERNGNLVRIHDDTSSHHQFELISSGDIKPGTTIFFFSGDPAGVLSDDFYDEVASLAGDRFRTLVEDILTSEAKESFHILRLVNNPPQSSLKGRGTLQGDIARMRFTDGIKKIFKSDYARNKFSSLGHFLEKKDSSITLGFLIVGIIIFFGLVSTLLSAILGVNNSSMTDEKNQIIKAKTLIDDTQKLASNLQAFEKTIREAESILGNLKQKQLYIKDVTELSARIEALKKEMYDIQTVDLRNKKSIISFNPLDISPIGAFEIDKKITIIGKNGIIFRASPSESVPKVLPYPGGEEGIDFTRDDDGNFFLLTKSNRVLASRNSLQVSYVNVTGQSAWENADLINTFNGNIYLTNKKEGQIYKHRPGVNGFSQKADVLTTPIQNIQDIGIDGGYYVMTQGQSIYRITNTRGYSQSGLILNKIPGEYSLGNNGAQVSLTLEKNLRFLYVLDGNYIWIFEPDSKRFQDIRAWNYIAKMEVLTPDEIRSISIPRDGLIYIVTNLGIYDAQFDFVDNKIILRN